MEIKYKKRLESDDKPLLKDEKKSEKVRIFSQDALRNTKPQKKDKKNIVKNIVKIFMSWLEKKP